MTKNQIEYNKLLETKRANRANERLTEQRDIAARDLGLNTLQENARHNRQVELTAVDNLAEQQRANLAKERELQRSHLASEGIANAQLSETVRSHLRSEELNQAGLEETKRRNVANEDLTLRSIEAGLSQAATSAAAHTAAAGISAAASQYASDQALLGHQIQSDTQHYVTDVNAGLRSREIREQTRSNLAREAEQKRSNVVNEALKSGSLMETVRNNLVQNSLSAQRNAADVNLRRSQIAVSAREADTHAKQAQTQHQVAQSQSFGNYVKSARDIILTAGTLVGG